MSPSLSRLFGAARLIAAVLALAWLAGCATRNVISDGEDRNLMLRGNDPVAYFTMNQAVKGNPAHQDPA